MTWRELCGDGVVGPDPYDPPIDPDMRRCSLGAGGSVIRLVALLGRGRGGRLAVAALIVRIVAGLIVAGFGIGKFTRHAAEAASFVHYGIPYPDQMTFVVGVVELGGGVALVVGFLTRLVALALAVNFAVAVATAGRIDGGIVNLGLAPALLIAMVSLIYAGSGPCSLDQWAVARLHTR